MKLLFLECIAGHFLEADTCVACPRGEWKVAGKATSCNDCPGNQATENNGTTSEEQCGNLYDKTKIIYGYVCHFALIGCWGMTLQCSCHLCSFVV